MFMRLRRAWWAFRQPVDTSLMVAPPPIRDMQEAIRSIRPTKTPFMEMAEHDQDEPPAFLGRPQRSLDETRDLPSWAKDHVYTQEPALVPTHLPPPPPERPMPEDAIMDAYEAAAREVEDNLRTVYAAYKIALDEGLGLVTEIRFRGEFERQRTRNQMELAKNLVVNFRERKKQLETPAEQVTGHAMASSAA